MFTVCAVFVQLPIIFPFALTALPVVRFDLRLGLRWIAVFRHTRRRDFILFFVFSLTLFFRLMIDKLQNKMPG